MDDPPAPPATTREVAILLAEIGTLLGLNGGDSFRARAFTSAAQALEGVDADLVAFAKSDQLVTLRGVGAGIASVIREYVLTGESRLHAELRAATPIGMHDLLRIPALGPKRIHTLYARLGIDSLDSLESAAAAGEIAALPGFGAKTEKKILEGIPFARRSRQLRRYPDALEVARRLVGWLRELPDVREAEIAGQLRRRMEVVDRIDLVASADDPEAILEKFRSSLGMGDAAAIEDTADGEATLRLTDGLTTRLRCVPPTSYVEALLWETGSPEHVSGLARLASEQRGRLDPDALRIDGLRVRSRSEAAIYKRLGIAFVPPELREGLDELELAATERIPRLIDLADLRGTFHCHSTYSDGKATIAEMATGARERGWSYLGLGDHSRTASYAGGLSIEQVRTQHSEVESLNRSFLADDTPFHIFKGIESDILPDGSLDYPDAVLREFDYVVGSVHSSFGMDRREMTKRLIRATEHESLTILGHLTGRLLLRRSGYEIDVEAVLEAAARAQAVIEINANPHRLDLDWRHVKTAARLGILIAINPDAHSVAALDNVAFGVNMARKSGLEPRQVLNTWPLDEVAEFFAKRK
jgi:DNA polymerase (family 10)